MLGLARPLLNHGFLLDQNVLDFSSEKTAQSNENHYLILDLTNKMFALKPTENTFLPAIK